jgi:hypothetical protein|tara:strand:- start:680 stop:1282 length:603 start_codon:yes stop_codon:yes gene_type:complete
MDFEKKGYTVLKGVLPEKVANFVYKYFLMKRKVADIFYKNKYIPPNSPEWGIWTDAQVPGTYSAYGDIAMETILIEIKPLMERITNKNLFETYAYARIYKKGDVLHKHTDRFSCEISTTLNLGGDPWPIYIEPGVKIDLDPGDMLVYKGNLLQHWRDEFTGTDCAQVFLHYNDVNTEGSKKNRYDGRVTLGIPREIKFNV